MLGNTFILYIRKGVTLSLPPLEGIRGRTNQKHTNNEEKGIRARNRVRMRGKVE